ncbi:hypothetical protein HBI38_182210 [Parastagonospora nodorum]|nr:hypothetical protein HBI38_182210 [Parastagonospora nodorum]
MSGSGSDSLTEELRAKITRLAAEATTKLATEGLAEQVDILTASNIEYAAFLEEWKKQPGGSQHGSQLPSVRDTTLSAPVHHRLPSAPLPHRQEAFTEDALQLHIALPNRKFDTSFEPNHAPALAPEETLCVAKVRTMRLGPHTDLGRKGKLPATSYARNPHLDFGLCEVAFGGGECPNGAECAWRHHRLTDIELAMPGFHGRGIKVVTAMYFPQKFQLTAWDDM